jgi:hypothetical protein
MRFIRRLAIIFCAALAAWLFLFSAVRISSTPPKESKIISDFNAHRAAYEQMRMMLSEDKGVEGVAP